MLTPILFSFSSSISEACRLAKMADANLDQDDKRLSGNNLWAAVMNLLSNSKSAKPNGQDHVSKFATSLTQVKSNENPVTSR